jgi:hypothetical protein
MSASRRLFRLLGSACALVALAGVEVASAQAVDPDNPTCPRNPNWSTNREMRFTVQEVNGRQVLLAEGVIDENLVPRLQEAIQNFQGDEIWLRSPGGDAHVGNQAGRLIRDNSLITRIPAGWACFSACNFLFMGGVARFIDPGGIFMVHMFTHTSNREAIRSEVAGGEDSTIGLIGTIEQQSAQLASEDNDFLIRMGLSRRLLTDVMYQVRAVADESSRETRRCLTTEQARLYNVTTELLDQN